jgi:hypothetical protein
MKDLSILLIIISLASCVSSIQSDVPFDSREVQFFKQRGNSTVKGELFALQRGGGVVIGAGREVVLIPVSKYQEDICLKLFGNTQGGYKSAFMHPKIDHNSESKEYLSRSTTNSRGEFKFNNLSKGEYYIYSFLTWEAGGAIQGGSIMQRVVIGDPEVKEVNLKF